jgi:hypothetical protein
LENFDWREVRNLRQLLFLSDELLLSANQAEDQLAEEELGSGRALRLKVLLDSPSGEPLRIKHLRHDSFVS